MTLHIRGCGQWTNRLYDYVEDKKMQEAIASRRTSSARSRHLTGNSVKAKNNGQENGTAEKITKMVLVDKWIHLKYTL